MALNTTVWAAISWSLLLLPDESHKAAISNYHFLNQWQQDGSRNGVNRTDQQKVRTYVVDRAITFFTLLASDEQVVAQV